MEQLLDYMGVVGLKQNPPGTEDFHLLLSVRDFSVSQPATGNGYKASNHSVTGKQWLVPSIYDNNVSCALMNCRCFER